MAKTRKGMQGCRHAASLMLLSQLVGAALAVLLGPTQTAAEAAVNGAVLGGLPDPSGATELRLQPCFDTATATDEDGAHTGVGSEGASFAVLRAAQQFHWDLPEGVSSSSTGSPAGFSEGHADAPVRLASNTSLCVGVAAGKHPPFPPPCCVD